MCPQPAGHLLLHVALTEVAERQTVAQTHLASDGVRHETTTCRWFRQQKAVSHLALRRVVETALKLAAQGARRRPGTPPSQTSVLARSRQRVEAMVKTPVEV